jgi:hypothetical protein
LISVEGIPDLFKQTTRVEPADPFEVGERDSLEGPPRSTPMDHLGFLVVSAGAFS